MAPKKKPDDHKHDGLLNLRVDEAVAREFRAEAARLGKRQNVLFLEMWELYKGGRDVTA